MPKWKSWLAGAVWMSAASCMAACGGSSGEGGTGSPDAAGDGSAVGDDASMEDAASDAGGNVDAGKDAGATEGGVHNDAGNGLDSGGDSQSEAGGATGLHVVNNTLVDGNKVVRLLGVDRSGTEYMCIQNAGIYDGAVDQTAIAAITAWHANAVRVPLNEDCWLAINGAPSQYSGTTYQNAIAQLVTTLRQAGLYVIVDLHWNNGGTGQATGQQQMADADHAPAFWTSVANAFKSDQDVVFDLYNEPHDISWSCWLSGGCQVNGWNVAGMQQLLDAVRGTGATNVVMAGGLAYANDLTGWLANEPNDPLHNLTASHHSYNFNSCSSQSCWTSQLAPVAQEVPLITGELGENDCAHGYIDGYMSWADSAGVSYLGWAWNADFNCNSGPSLITDYTGTPTAFGAGLQAHLAIVNP
jgi:endoglucanase